MTDPTPSPFPPYPHVVYPWCVKSTDGQPTRLYGTRAQARRAARRLSELDPANRYVPAKLYRPVRKAVGAPAHVEEGDYGG